MQDANPERIEETEGNEPLGLGGWLSFLQTAMVLALLAAILLTADNLDYGYFLKAAGLLVITAVIIMSIIRFYQYKIIFRLYLAACVVLLILYYYTLSDNAHLSFSENWQVIIAFVIILAPVIALFFSKRVKNTFCEETRQKIKQSKEKNPPVGINGWLVLFQLNMISIFYNSAGIVWYSITEEKAVTIITVNAVIAAVLIVFCAVLFYKRRIQFRKVYIYTVSFVIVNELLDLFPVGRWYGKIITFAVIAAVYGLLIAALYKSERVKNTFR